MNVSATRTAMMAFRILLTLASLILFAIAGFIAIYYAPEKATSMHNTLTLCATLGSICCAVSFVLLCIINPTYFARPKSRRITEDAT